MALHEGGLGDYLGPAISAGVPAYLQYRGQQDTNTKNLQIAREQMEFQERMSSTAYQRSMADLRKSGLNPMLAYQQGGASSPGGASATMQNALGGAVSSAQEARRMKSELKLLATQERKTGAEGVESQARTQESYMRREFISSQDLQTREQTLMTRLQRMILELQLPALRNSARVEQSKVGRQAAWIDRIRQSLFGGRGLFNPIGGGR